MTPKVLEGALGMVARLIPAEQYAKGIGALQELIELLKKLDARAAAIEANTAQCVRQLADQDARLCALEAAAAADSPAFAALRAEQAMWMMPGSIDAALAPSKGGDNGG